MHNSNGSVDHWPSSTRPLLVAVRQCRAPGLAPPRCVKHPIENKKNMLCEGSQHTTWLLRLKCLVLCNYWFFRFSWGALGGFPGARLGAESILREHSSYPTKYQPGRPPLPNLCAVWAHSGITVGSSECTVGLCV